MRSLARYMRLHHLRHSKINLRLLLRLENSLFWRINEVFDLCVYQVHTRRKPGMDRRDEIYANPRQDEDGNQQFNVQAISFLHWKDYITKGF